MTDGPHRPIRVIHVITRLILGGAQENTLLTVEGLQARRDYKVTLISGPALGPEGELVKRAQQNKVNLIIIPEMRRNIYPLKDFITFIKLYRLIQKLKPDIVHTHSSKAGILARAAAKLARVRLIIHTIHGLPYHPYQSRIPNAFFIWLERLAAIWSNKIISVAKAMTEQSLKAGVGRPEQFVTIHSGIELDKFSGAGDPSSVKQKLGIKEREKVIGVIGRLFPLKGHKYILEIAPEIIKVIPEARFLFIGDGILKANLIEDARRRGILERITFAGLVQTEQIPDMIRIMDVLVHPSLREGLPRAVPQALAMNRPVVSFDVDGAREVVLDKKTGRLIPPDSLKELSDAIISILKNPQEANLMARTGQKLVYERFDARQMVEQIHDLYQKLLESP